jgi:hypothetical protein
MTFSGSASGPSIGAAPRRMCIWRHERVLQPGTAQYRSLAKGEQLSARVTSPASRFAGPVRFNALWVSSLGE